MMDTHICEIDTRLTEQAAHAYLIKAAPLMLAALKEVCGACEEFGWDNSHAYAQLLDTMRQAIAAAEPQGGGQ
jgi:hypothetical protein